MREVAGPHRGRAVPQPELDANLDLAALEMRRDGRLVIAFDRQAALGDPRSAETNAQPVALGRFAGWGDTVAGYGEFLAGCGVPLKVNWAYQALVLDGFVASRIAKKEEKRDGVAKKARK